MSNLNIIIIEDEFFVGNHLSDLIESFGHKTLEIYFSGEDFLKNTDWEFDAAIVDILLSEKLTGLDVAQKMNEKNKPFIFSTANEDPETIKEIARLKPAAFISKPFNPIDISVALEIISSNVLAKLKIKGIYGMEEIDCRDILYIRTDGNYVVFHTLTECRTQRMSLREIIDNLPPCFKQVHRYYVVNTDFIEQKSRSQIILKGEVIPVSRKYKENLI